MGGSDGFFVVPVFGQNLSLLVQIHESFQSSLCQLLELAATDAILPLVQQEPSGGFSEAPPVAGWRLVASCVY